MPANLPFLPYGKQNIDDDDIAAVAQVLRGDFLTTGPATDAFEAALAEATGARHAISCSSGTAALHLATLALGIGPGDVVIVPTVTFLATANAARYVGANVVFADVDPDSGVIRPEDLSNAIERANGKAKAVFLVYLAGQAPDMSALSALAKQHNLAVAEDACHALDTRYGGNRQHIAGGCDHADMACFSFHPVKTIAMGEGGAVTTNDDALAHRLRLARNHGMTRDGDTFMHTDMAFDGTGQVNPWYYEMQDVGFNYRASDIHCALGASQLGKLATFARRRRDLAERYDNALTSLAPVVRPTARTADSDAAWHLYSVLIDFDRAGIERATVMRRLSEHGIGTQVHYIPVHKQPYYRTLYGDLNLPGADAYYARCLSLPMFPAMADSDIDRVVDALASVLDKT